jgi:DNA-directed RNA polymerase subunit E'/Rpb7
MSSRIASSSQSRRNAVAGKMSLYIKNIISKKLSVPIKYVGTNIAEILEQILSNNFEGKCCIEGYVKRGSVKIVTFSSGTIVGNCIIFTVVFEYLVCNPPQGMRISCAVKNITNAGILAHTDEGEYSPLNIFIARDHHYNVAYFSELKEGDIIMVRVIGQRFELNDPFVSVIGELELKQERESGPSVMREIENAKKKGNPLSVVLEENSDMLGEFQISNEADAAAAAVAIASDEEPEELEESEESEKPAKEISEVEGKVEGEVEGKNEGKVEGEVEGKNEGEGEGEGEGQEDKGKVEDE